MANFLRALLAWLFTAVYWSVLSVVLVLSFGALPKRWLQKALRGWGHATLRILSIRLVVEGPNPLDERKARVVVVNHQSALDIVWGAAIVAPAPMAIGKRELIYIPFLNLVWWSLRFVRIDRRNPKKAIQQLNGMASLLVRGRRTLFISPEGTRTPDGTILPFKKGAFHIAIEAQVPIQPVVVTGAYELLPKQRAIPKPGVIRLRFLEPIETRGLGKADVEALAEKTRDSMVAAYK